MWNKSFKNLCVCCLLASVAGCSVLFPTKVPAPGEVHTAGDNIESLEQHFSQNAIINQEPPVPPVNNAPV